ncbi:hypothetical protein HMPREF1085_02299 [Enterocloster bolteae 90A9]|uniref:Uncharacterized protein n=1 Tax=Enterocloster bolteae 90A9 TaxID=997894 RepID=R0AFH0_9FIRM|nr:hypothetical protein HMPREF1089_01178 [Enterocloster bolteae 90B3]ENZ50816.1 hypothetical protein HMPREF1085_02299 [Enterocloster bolteae 90A9]
MCEICEASKVCKIRRMCKAGEKFILVRIIWGAVF